ncbi:MAG: hypothetical protein AABZ53_11165 [Planctomycetota bacterium]|mgnify:CR=1 FL=1
MVRAIVGVVAGYVVWSVLWVGAGMVLFTEAAAKMGRGEMYADVGPLAVAIGLSVVCSLVAGFTCAKIVPGKPGLGAAAALSASLLATGILVQSGVWNLEPLWYHLTFLALLVPMTLVGARLGK